MAADALTLRTDGHVAEITLTRPELFNRFDDELHVEFTQVLQSLRRDEKVRAVVLASTGKVFSAGGDFDLMRAAQADVAPGSRSSMTVVGSSTRSFPFPSPWSSRSTVLPSDSEPPSF